MTLVGEKGWNAVRGRAPRHGAAVLVVLLLAAPAGALVQYDDVTDEVGVDFRIAGEVHGTLQDHWPGFPEIMGGGACWADLDNDGFDDLYLVNQRFNPENPFARDWMDAHDPVNHLYLNDGEGGFVDATESSGLSSPSWGYGCSVADYDGDRDLDVYVSGFGVSELYRNDGDAVFTEVTEEAGLVTEGLCFEYECMGTSTAWADYDLDGDLDLYVGNYVETTLDDLARGPIGHIAQKNFLFRNNGDGTFTTVADEAGVAGNPSDEHGSKSLGVVWFDYDLDGDPDLYVANDEVPNDFYVNNGDGTFTEDDGAGLANDLAGMGVASGDYNSDMLPDLFFTHYQAEENGFYQNNGDGTFRDRSGEDELTSARDNVGWGTAFVDVDRDGDLDIIAANGHTEWTLADYGQKTRIWLNDGVTSPGNHNWVDVTDNSGAGLAVLKTTRGAAFADYDLDGDTDIALVSNGNDTAQILRASNLENNWLRISLIQSGPNPFAVGARVVAVVNGISQVREIQTGTSYLSQNELAASFGLGSATHADSITVHWPGGGTTLVENVAGNRAIGIDRDLGAVVEDILAPATRLMADGELTDQLWFNRPVVLTLHAEDRGSGQVSGVQSTMLDLDGAGLATYTGQAIQLEAEGLRTLRYHSYDLAGNREPIRTAEIGIDTINPTANLVVSGMEGQNGWWTSDVDLRVQATDDRSGIAQRSIRIDGGPWQAYTGPVTLTGDGIHLVEYQAVDKAGNTSPMGQEIIKIDSAKPVAHLVQPKVGTLYVAGEVFETPSQGRALIVSDNRHFPVRTSTHDATSGIDRVEIRVDGYLQAVLTEPPYTWYWPLEGEEAGNRVIKVFSFDKAGHVRVDQTKLVLLHSMPGGVQSGTPLQ